MPVDLDTDTALAAVCAERAGRDQAEARLLMAVLDWAAEHVPDDVTDFAAGYDNNFGDTELTLAGPGAPVVGEFATYELAAALKMSSDAGKAYVGNALELKHRLPKVFARVVAGDLRVWKAFRIATETLGLPIEGATHVDRALAPFAHKLSFAQLERTVEEARATFDPVEAEARRLAALAQRRFDIDLDPRHLSLAGTVEVSGTLSLADGLDLDEAVRHTARGLAEAGCTESLDTRRSLAVGELARNQHALDFERVSSSSTSAGGGRGVVLHVHLSHAAVARLENTGTNVLIEQIATWCGEATKVTLKPVIDLDTCDPVDSYDIPDRTREHVDLRDRHCVFPYCTRPARSCDHDHITSWPEGQTCPCQIAPLCRRHHRTKTHSAWAYVALDPGVYLWRSPNGLTFLRDHHGTSEP